MSNSIDFLLVITAFPPVPTAKKFFRTGGGRGRICILRLLYVASYGLQTNISFHADIE